MNGAPLNAATWHKHLLFDILLPLLSDIFFSSITFVPSAACSLVYLVLGLLCFDRFTSRAFLSHKDPIASTAIPQGNAPHQTPQIALHNNYNPPGGGVGA